MYKSSTGILINPPVVFTLMRQRWSSTNFSHLLYLPYICEHQIHIHTWQLLPFSLRQQCIYFYKKLQPFLSPSYPTCMRYLISKKTLLIWVWRRSALCGFRYSQNKKSSYKKFKNEFSFFLFLLTARTFFLLTTLSANGLAANRDNKMFVRQGHRK